MLMVNRTWRIRKFCQMPVFSIESYDYDYFVLSNCELTSVSQTALKHDVDFLVNYIVRLIFVYITFETDLNLVWWLVFEWQKKIAGHFHVSRFQEINKLPTEIHTKTHNCCSIKWITKILSIIDHPTNVEVHSDVMIDTKRMKWN